VLLGTGAAPAGADVCPALLPCPAPVDSTSPPLDGLLPDVADVVPAPGDSPLPAAIPSGGEGLPLPDPPAPGAPGLLPVPASGTLPVVDLDTDLDLGAGPDGIVADACVDIGIGRPAAATAAATAAAATVAATVAAAVPTTCRPAGVARFG